MSFLDFNFLSLKKTLYFLCLAITSFALGQEKPGLTVFIHGTVGSTLSVFSPLNLSGDTLDESTASARAVKRFRNHELMGYDQIMGQEGLHDFVQIIDKNVPVLTAMGAANYLIPAYDDLMAIYDIKAEVQNYAIFGWSGLLHNAARKKAGYDLYNALCDYRHRVVIKYGIEPEITLVTHSHGGNVALYMARTEIEQQKKLKIHCLVMYGSPMMSEMAHCIESDMFKTIIMLYSKGDEVQPRDIFSSKKKKSHQRMADIVDRKKFNKNNKPSKAQLKRYDLCCIVDSNTKKITHTNMWLVGRSTAISQSMDLLPLMVLTPTIIACTLQSVNHINDAFIHANLHLVEKEKLFKVCVAPDCHAIKLYAPYQEFLKERLLFWDMQMLNEWQSKDDLNRHPLFNKKTMQIARFALLG